MKVLYVIGQSQYDSTAVFMQEMAAHMAERGWDVCVLDGRDGQKYEAQRESVLSQQFDVIFTINGMLLEKDSTLGKALLQDGKPIYCTYLMDHPLIHYERLRSSYPKLFVVSPDRLHVQYTDAYLPNVWGTAFLPHAGCVGKVCKPYRERTIEISFMGSYTSAERIRAEFGDYPEEMQILLHAAADLLVQQPDMALEQAVECCLRQYGISVSTEKMAEVMQEFRIVDRFIRSYYRESVIRTLVEAGITVEVWGDGWEQFSCKNRDKLIVHPAVSYAQSLDIIGNSRIALNSMPWFKDGSHDRVFTAMLCGAVCLTDGSAWMEEQLRETEQVYFYSLKGLKYLPSKVRKILQNTERSTQVAERGQQLALAQHTWANRAEEMMDYWEQLRNIPAGDDKAALLQTFRQEVVCPNIRLLHRLTRAVEYIRRQEYLYAMRETTAVIDALGALLPVWTSHKDLINSAGDLFDESSLLRALQELLDAQQNQDYVLLADLMELRLIPFITAIQELYAEMVPICEPVGDRYRIEAASSGEYTLAARRGEEWIYLHSNGDPYQEGRRLAQSWFDGEHYDYVVYGLGLGYPIAGLLELDEAICVRVLEPEPEVISAAREYGCLQEWMDSGRLEIIEVTDAADLTKALEHLGETARFVIHYPSLMQLTEEHYRVELEQYFIEYSSAQTQLPRLHGNFIRNKGYLQKEVSELRDRFQGKTIYIIAAGPSLDKNMMELKHVSKNAVILATGTVLKKLLAAGITPDYVMIIDGGAATYRQTEKLTETKVPLLYLPTVYHRILTEYPGERYLVCQRGFSKSEQYAEEHGYPLYESGGSVTTAAIDVSIRLGCRRIVLVGLDLAYTGQRDHAEGTAYAREGRRGSMLVEDVEGNLVETARNLDIYRRWIEKRIQEDDAKTVEWVDATEGGAKIRGTVIRRLSEEVR